MWAVFFSAMQGCVVSRLGEAVFWVADFDSTPVASSYQTDETQQVGKRPGHVGGIVTTGKVPSTDLLTKNREKKGWKVNIKNKQNFKTLLHFNIVQNNHYLKNKWSIRLKQKTHKIIHNVTE